HWRPERCLAQLRYPGCAADLGLAEMSVAEAADQGARTLVIGTAPPGGQLPEPWIDTLEDALAAGLDLASGLHQRLTDIPRLAEAASRHGRRLSDVRHSDRDFPVASGRPRAGHRLVTVGTDCAVGKKYTALSIEREMRARGMKADFRATGQTSILIAGEGIAIDAVVADFVAGATETLCPANDADHWDIIEGQGSLFHPAYAGVTLGLLHGAQADFFVVCHDAGRQRLSGGYEAFATGDVAACIEWTRAMGALVRPEIACAGISVNTASLAEADARAYLAGLSEQHRLPAADPVRFGVATIVDALKTAV
ncbi:MAG TPA: DUF1611 domain-containing protein, partial [Afifellaceae bacterium]|nr:DUF1611 domain-containing protein [Afifellaceae bacterium]